MPKPRNLPKRISIHALREEGDDRPPEASCAGHISIHALREEGDAAPGDYYAHRDIFLSTPSARRATNTYTS